MSEQGPKWTVIEVYKLINDPFGLIISCPIKLFINKACNYAVPK